MTIARDVFAWFIVTILASGLAVFLFYAIGSLWLWWRERRQWRETVSSLDVSLAEAGRIVAINNQEFIERYVAPHPNPEAEERAWKELREILGEDAYEGLRTFRSWGWKDADGVNWRIVTTGEVRYWDTSGEAHQNIWQPVCLQVSPFLPIADQIIAKVLWIRHHPDKIRVIVAGQQMVVCPTSAPISVNAVADEEIHVGDAVEVTYTGGIWHGRRARG